MNDITQLYQQIYQSHPRSEYFFHRLTEVLDTAREQRPTELKAWDSSTKADEHWFLSNKLAGMSIYVDRWSGKLNTLPSTLPYLENLGVNLLHLMPIFQSPAGESDGGYAVSDFRTVDERFGTLDNLRDLRRHLSHAGMYLMMDIVLNHTSHRHEWAEKARQGDPRYQDYYYMFDDRTLPDEYERSMPEIFPESSPGNFIYDDRCGKWVMTVFHDYQWDLNYRNPDVFVAMMENILFYANLGVDILRIDAPAFIWKEPGTSCQNLPMAHTLLRLIKACVKVAAPGMALLGEAIVAPEEIMKYFGTGSFTARECDLAYNATQMALQWDALATGDTRIMLSGQPQLSIKPRGCTWITYTRCHDDIGLGYADSLIAAAGYTPFAHRKFLQEYYCGKYPAGDATGALFSFNPKTQDARISGSLASLCGLEKALAAGDPQRVSTAITRILLMQAQSFFLGGIPMLFYGDEAGYTNDYSYLMDSGKSYDNRWMHRPLIDWNKNALTAVAGSVEEAIFTGTRRLLALRKKLDIVADQSNIRWVTCHNQHIACFVRSFRFKNLYCVFNYSPVVQFLTFYAFREAGEQFQRLYDHWSEIEIPLGADEEFLAVPGYGFRLLEARQG